MRAARTGGKVPDWKNLQGTADNATPPKKTWHVHRGMWLVHSVPAALPHRPLEAAGQRVFNALVKALPSKELFSRKEPSA